MNDTTVKIHQGTKNVLESIKGEYETYDDVINKLISEVKDKNLVKEMIAGYKSNRKEDRKSVEEWKSASKDWD